MDPIERGPRRQGSMPRRYANIAHGWLILRAEAELNQPRERRTVPVVSKFCGSRRDRECCVFATTASGTSAARARTTPRPTPP